jgi:hypothetical protein
MWRGNCYNVISSLHMELKKITMNFSQAVCEQRKKEVEELANTNLDRILWI